MQSDLMKPLLIACALVVAQGCVLHPSGGRRETRAGIPSLSPVTNAVFLLGRLPPVEPVLTPLAEIDGAYGAFEHALFESSGVNPLVLPFHDMTQANGTGPVSNATEAAPARPPAATDTNAPESAIPEGASRESMAFSALLSSALDWTPGNYVNCHAYYIFKRDRQTMLRLAQSYDRRLIVSAMDEWKSTHAVGGCLWRLGNGYAGTLVVYGRDGVPVLERRYQEARGYFALLADMTFDAMGIFGYNPPPDLREHLRKPRCAEMASIADLGSAAFVDLRSADEFRIYRHILARSPEFAEVRAWMALMGHWAGMPPKVGLRQALRSLNDYLNPQALLIAAPRLVTRAEAATNGFPAILAAFARMTGPDHPLLIQARALTAEEGGLPLDRPLLIELARTAARYPNEWMLSSSLSSMMAWKSGGPYDAITAMECAASEQLSRATLFSHNRTDPNTAIAYGFRAMGQAHRAIPFGQAVLQTGDQNYSDWLSGRAADLAAWMEQAGLPGRAAEKYRLAAKYRRDPESREKLRIQAALCAMIAGDLSAGRELLAHPAPGMAQHAWRHVVQAYLDVAGGRITTREQLATNHVDLTYPPTIYGTALHVQIQAAQGRIGTNTVSEVWWWFSVDPGDRRLWFLMDACERTTSNPDWMASFYDALPWLYGDDPWVQQTCAEWRGKHPGVGGATPEAALEMLKNYEPLPWPVLKSDSSKKAWWATPRLQWKPLFLESAIRTALAKGRYDQAEEIVLRALHEIAVIQEYPPADLLRHLNWVYHKVQAAKQKAGLTKRLPAPERPAAGSNAIPRPGAPAGARP